MSRLVERFLAGGWCMCVGLVLLGTAAPSVRGQEVFDEGDGQFATRQLQASVTVKAQKRLKIVSVPSLEGTLNISVADQEAISRYRTSRGPRPTRCPARSTTST